MEEITLNKIIYNLRRIIAGGSISDDDSFPSSQCEFIINNKRSLLLKEYIQKDRAITSEMTQTITLEMQVVDKNECQIDLPTGCTITRSIKNIPSILEFNDVYAVRFLGLLDDTPIHLTSFAQANWHKYRKFVKNKKVAFIRNNYVYVINPQLLEYIKLDAIFTSPRDAAEFLCPTGNCFTLDSRYPFPAYLIDTLNRLVYDSEFRLLLAAKLADNTNDTKDNILPK